MDDAVRILIRRDGLILYNWILSSRREVPQKNEHVNGRSKRDCALKKPRKLQCIDNIVCHIVWQRVMDYRTSRQLRTVTRAWGIKLMLCERVIAALSEIVYTLLSTRTSDDVTKRGFPLFFLFFSNIPTIGNFLQNEHGIQRQKSAEIGKLFTPSCFRLLLFYN